MKFAMDYLGGSMFSSILLTAHPVGWGAGFFAETFGNCWPVVDKLAASGKCPLIRIQGPWTNHKYMPALHDKAIFTAHKKTVEMMRKYPAVDFQFSPVCESDVKGRVWQDLFARLFRTNMTLKLVCSVGTRGELVKGILAEVHGSTPAPRGEYNYSYDGTSTVDSDITKDKRTHRRASVMFLWHPSFNLRYKTKLSGEEIPEVKKNDTAAPKDRHCKPTVELIASMAAQASDKGKCRLAPNVLWKSHADRHDTPAEPRAYKPVLIAPPKVDRITLEDDFGRVVATSIKRDPYNDGRYRYYFSSYGHEIGNRVLNVKAGTRILGTLNPAFRQGGFRK